jgi:hypothetical protein
MSNDKNDKFWSGLPQDRFDFLHYNVGREAREAIQYPVAREHEESITRLRMHNVPHLPSEGSMTFSEVSRLSTYRCTVCQTDRCYGVGYAEQVAQLRCSSCSRLTPHQYVEVNEYLVEYEARKENAKGRLFTYSPVSKMIQLP